MTNIVGKIGRKNIVQIHNENPKNLLKDNEILVTKNGDETQFTEKVNGKLVDYVRGDRTPDTPAEKTGVNPELLTYMGYYTAGSGKDTNAGTFINDLATWGKTDLYVVFPEIISGKLYVQNPSVKVVSGTYTKTNYRITKINLILSASLTEIDGVKTHYPFIVYFRCMGSNSEDLISANDSNTWITAKFYDVEYASQMTGVFIADTKGNIINYGYYSDRSNDNAPEYNRLTDIELKVNIEE